MVTNFGKMIRIYRINHGLMLKDMANRLNIPSSYLSAIEMGRKPISAEFIEKLKSNFPFTDEEEKELNIAIETSAAFIKIDLTSADSHRKTMALNFARKFETLDNDTIDKILKCLKEEAH